MPLDHPDDHGALGLGLPSANQADHGRRSRLLRPHRPWQHLLITDIDNTLFDFGLYVEAGLEAVARQAGATLHLSSERVVAELQSAFKVFNSVEVPYAYEILDSIRARPAGQRSEHSAALAAAFWRGALPMLQPYPGVQSTMAHLWRNGVAVVAVTDAPMMETWRKLRQLGLLQYMAGVIAVGSTKRRSRPLLTLDQIPEYMRPYRSSSRFYRLLGKDDRKPSPLAYVYAIEETQIPKDRVTVVGDSPVKDLGPARQLGLDAVWAGYGERHRELEWLLQAVTPFEPPEAVRNQAKAAQGFPQLGAFSELELYIKLDVAQPSLPYEWES